MRSLTEILTKLKMNNREFHQASKAAKDVDEINIDDMERNTMTAEDGESKLTLRVPFESWLSSSIDAKSRR